MKNILKLSITLVALPLTLSVLTPINSVSAAQKTVTVGIVGTSEQDLWKSVAETAKKESDIKVKTKIFTDYNTPNKALVDGSLDLNAFQHTNFLNNWNKSNNNQLKSIGKTYLTPMRIYSNNAHDVKDIKAHTTIAIPNDPTNEGRALTLLQTAGLIKLKKTELPTIKDIKENKLQIKFKEIAADQTPSALKSVDAAVINANYAQEAHLAIKKSIYVEPINKASKQWINIIVVNKKQAKNKTYQAVVKAYQTKKTEQYFKQTWGDTQLPAWNIKLK